MAGWGKSSGVGEFVLAAVTSADVALLDSSVAGGASCRAGVVSNCCDVPGGVDVVIGAATAVEVP